MEKQNLKREIVFWILLALPFIYIIYLWPTLPDIVPIHFDIHNQPNDWGSKAFLFLMPGVSILIYLLLFFIPHLDPKKMSDEFFKTNFYKIRLVLAVFLAALSFIITRSMAGDFNFGGRWLGASIFLLLALLGNFMINIKPNWFVGIRTPWTLSNDVVWKKTHQVGGRVFFYGGLACFALNFLLPVEYSIGLVIAFAVSSVLFSLIYSFILFKQEEKKSAPNQKPPLNS